MEPVGASATLALRSLLGRQPTTPAKVAFAWRLAAGLPLARAGTPRWSDGDGILHVHVSDATWRREIRRAQSLIAARLDDLLGAGVVRRLLID
jgi:hypothetical protein